MIYLDAAATSFQKPRQVREEMLRTIRSCTSPGRGGYPQAMCAAELLLDCRMALAKLLGVPEPEQVVFTTNATHGLNIAIRNLVRPGTRVVVSGYEHNAVMRPLYACGAALEILRTPVFDSAAAAAAFREAIPRSEVCVCTHVSNVFGNILPLEEIAACCRENGVPLVVDASQSAGALPLDFQALGAAYAAMPGHKGLLGPQGTGVLLCRQVPEPLLFGGTGVDSRSHTMPDFLPERLEAGTPNVPGVAGLLAGVRFIQRVGTERILRHERQLVRRLGQLLAQKGGGKVMLAQDAAEQAGVLSVIPEQRDCESLAAALGQAGVAVRAGLHCAPQAHITAGDVERGSLRFSVSVMNTRQEMLQAAERYGKIVTKL